MIDPKGQFRADLHSHTICSDGSDSPSELLKLAKKSGLSGLSITDHDTIAAYTPAFFAEANELGLRILTGIELSSEWQEQSVHVLGYNIDIHSQELINFLTELIKRRDGRNAAMIERLKKKGFEIDVGELQVFGDRTIGRPHIAMLLKEKGYVTTIQEAFQKYLGEQCSCFVAGIKYTPSDVIEQIHKAGGRAVLAHPHFIKKKRLLEHLMELKLDGLECYYGVFQDYQERPWVTLAKKRGWVATGGSDYHGSVKPHIMLGCSWVREEIFNYLLTERGSVPVVY